MERQAKISSKSAEVVVSTDDLLLEILLHLPIESLIRFKSVSKLWLSLITNPIFCHRRNAIPDPPVGLFLAPSRFRHHRNYIYIPFSNRSTKPPFRKLEFTNDPSGIMILHSCNGLFLCRSFGPRNYYSFSRLRYYVYNPTTNQFSSVPEPVERTGTVVSKMYLFFDPSKSLHYRVVFARSMRMESGNCKTHIDVYSSDTGSWKACHESFDISLSDIRRGVYWNGSILWISRKGSSFSYFRLDNELFIEMPLPGPSNSERMASKTSIEYFGESCNHMHYIIRCPGIQLFVYELKSDFSEWFVKYRIDLRHVASAYPEMIRTYFSPCDFEYFVFAIFHLARGRTDENAFLVLMTTAKAIRYNFVLQTCETLHDFETADEDEYFDIDPPLGEFYLFPQNLGFGFQYVPSLCYV